MPGCMSGGLEFGDGLKQTSTTVVSRTRSSFLIRSRVTSAPSGDSRCAMAVRSAGYVESSVIVWVRWLANSRGWSVTKSVTRIAAISAGVTHAGVTLIPPSSPIASAVK